MNCYCISLKKLIRFLNANIEPSVIEKIFDIYVKKKDYNEKQITIFEKDC